MTTGPWLYILLASAIFGLACAICAVVFTRAGSDEDGSYGADEGDQSFGGRG